MSWGSKTVVFEHQRNSYSISQKYTLSKLVEIAEQKGNFVQKHQWESLGCSPYCKIQTRTILCSFMLLGWRWCKIDKHMQENIHKQFICNYLDGFVCLSKPFIYINACELYMNWTLGKKSWNQPIYANFEWNWEVTMAHWNLNVISKVWPRHSVH